MKSIDILRNRLHARADLNGDGKVDKQDIEVVIGQLSQAFNDDRAENIGWLLMGFGVGVFVTWLLMVLR